MVVVRVEGAVVVKVCGGGGAGGNQSEASGDG